MTARVLVVDDVPANVRLLEARLVLEYYEVLSAHDGPSALKSVTEEKPDIVLLDVMMPGMDGFEVCSRIKSDPALSHIPVVMVTALDDIENRVRGLEAGADDFLTKPVNDIALLARVRCLVRLKQTLDEWRMRQSTAERFGLTATERGLLDHGGEGKILLVGDEPTITQRAEDALVEGGQTVTCLTDGGAALEQAATGRFDLMIVDLRLAGEDALRLCSRIRSEAATRQLPLLIMVDEDDVERLTRALDMGVNDYVFLPPEPNELKARVRTQVRRRRYQERLRADVDRSLSLALVDSLTGLYNRRYLEAHLDAVVERGVGEGKPLSLLLIDIDRFKTVNDSYSHAVGDEVLRETAARIATSVRCEDLVTRLGGEEFVVVMPDTESTIAMAVAERLRTRIGGEPVVVSADVGSLEVTVSIGGSSLDPAGDTPESLLKRADDAMYEAKRAGRNRVIVDAQLDSPRPAAAGRAAAV